MTYHSEEDGDGEEDDGGDDEEESDDASGDEGEGSQEEGAALGQVGGLGLGGLVRPQWGQKTSPHHPGLESKQQQTMNPWPKKPQGPPKPSAPVA